MAQRSWIMDMPRTPRRPTPGQRALAEMLARGEAAMGAGIETIPASVYGFASIAGPILLANMAPEKAIVPTVISVIIGAAFGWVSEMLANAMTSKASGAPNAETASGG